MTKNRASWFFYPGNTGYFALRFIVLGLVSVLSWRILLSMLPGWEFQQQVLPVFWLSSVEVVFLAGLRWEVVLIELGTNQP